MTSLAAGIGSGDRPAGLSLSVRGTPRGRCENRTERKGSPVTARELGSRVLTGNPHTFGVTNAVSKNSPALDNSSIQKHII